MYRIMSVNMRQFETLREKFGNWDELKAHFSSEDCSGLRVVEQDDFAVIRYEKSANVDSIYRSVIWDKGSNLPVSVAPFRASSGSPPFGSEVMVEEFVDGFMVNVWVTDGVLRMATRTRVGGANKFYSDKTFGELFHECLSTTPLKTVDALQECLESLRKELNGVTAFASLVLQHPEHRIVSKISSPCLYVVHTGHVTETGAVTISEKAVHWPEALFNLKVPNYGPRTFQNEEDIEAFLSRMSAQRGWRWQGLVFKDGTGSRWRLRTPTYTLLRQLRGVEGSALERFFRLRTQRKVVDYLRHYGEERKAFWEFEKKFRALTEGVLLAYTDVHKAHSVTFKELPESVRPAVYLLHMKWRDELRPKGFSVRLQNAIDVVNQLRPFEKKRLMDSVPYVATVVASATGLEAEEVVTDTLVESEVVGIVEADV